MLNFLSSFALKTQDLNQVHQVCCFTRENKDWSYFEYEKPTDKKLTYWNWFNDWQNSVGSNLVNDT